jgi:hypothetical protein
MKISEYCLFKHCALCSKKWCKCKCHTKKVKLKKRKYVRRTDYVPRPTKIFIVEFIADLEKKLK